MSKVTLLGGFFVFVFCFFFVLFCCCCVLLLLLFWTFLGTRPVPLDEWLPISRNHESIKDESKRKGTIIKKKRRRTKYKIVRKMMGVKILVFIAVPKSMSSVSRKRRLCLGSLIIVVIGIAISVMTSVTIIIITNSTVDSESSQKQGNVTYLKTIFREF